MTFLAWQLKDILLPPRVKDRFLPIERNAQIVPVWALSLRQPIDASVEQKYRIALHILHRRDIGVNVHRSCVWLPYANSISSLDHIAQAAMQATRVTSSCDQSNCDKRTTASFDEPYAILVNGPSTVRQRPEKAKRKGVELF